VQKRDHTEIAIQSRFRAETMTPSYAITERMKSVTRRLFESSGSTSPLSVKSSRHATTLVASRA
jgi:hypothetical protein